MKIALFPALLLVLLQNTYAQMKPVIGFEGHYAQSSRADFRDDSNNSVSLRKVSSSISYTHPFLQGSSVAFGFSAERSDYDFEHPMSWKSVNDVSSSVMMELPTGSRWTFIGLGVLRSAWASDARFQDGIGWGAGLAGKYAYSETLSILYGVGYFTQLEGNDLWVPLIGIEWQINDRLSLEGLMGLALNYDISADGTSVLSVGFDYELSVFRLQTDAMSGLESAIRPEGVSASIAYTHRFSELATISLKVSTYGTQDFRTYSDGRKIGSLKTDSFVLCGIGFNVYF